jgi:uncharacterized membrane protein
MNEKLINPNYHPLLIHYPIALLVTGTLIEVFSFLGWRRHGFRSAGRWMILLGALSAVPAALSGIYALNDVVRAGVSDADASGSWHQLATASPLIKHSAAWAIMVRHVWLQGIATTLVVLVVTCWIACSDRLRGKLHFLFLLLLLAGIGLTGTGAWFGGEGVYQHAVGVADLSKPEPEAPGLVYYIDPLQMHVIGAGVALALAALSIGLAFRAMVTARIPEDFHGLDDVLGGHLHDSQVDPQIDPRPIAPATMGELSQRVPSARFALLTSLAALLTAAGGWWVLARGGESNVLAFHDLWMWIRDATQNNGFWLTRRLAHVICGLSIVIIPLLIAITTRFMPRSRTFLSVLTLLLLAVIAGQIWLGVLLINDSNAGPVTRFSPAESGK